MIKPWAEPGTFEMAIEIRDSSRINQVENLNEIRKLHDYLQALPSIQNLISPVTYYHGISKIYQDGLAPLEIPQSDSQLKKYEKKAGALHQKHHLEAGG